MTITVETEPGGFVRFLARLGPNRQSAIYLDLAANRPVRSHRYGAGIRRSRGRFQRAEIRGPVYPTDPVYGCAAPPEEGEATCWALRSPATVLSAVDELIPK